MPHESNPAGALSIEQVAKLYGISHDTLRLYDIRLTAGPNLGTTER